VNEYQPGLACPQCGSTAAVHSIQELADLARMQLAKLQQGPLGSGFGGPPQQGGVPGYAAEPGQINWQSGSTTNRDYDRYGGSGFDNYGGSVIDSLGEDIAGAALGLAGKFIGRAIGRRVQRAADQAMPIIAANAEARLRDQIAMAERHPDLRACLTDKVIFLAGGTKVVPMGDIMKMTPEQADAMVASLRTA